MLKPLSKLWIGITAVLLMGIFMLSGCGGGGGDGDSGDDVAGTPYSINGKIQKGPFLIGSSVTIQELNDDLEPTGTSFQTTTVNDLGHFNTTVEISTNYVEVITDGFYYDEVSGGFAAAPISLRTLSAFSEGRAININLLTQLAGSRVRTLVLGGMDFDEALAQAQEEVLAAFNITSVDVGDFDTLDIAGSGEGNAVLLAVSAVLMQTAIDRAAGGSIEAELSNLLATVGNDIEADGTLDSESALEDIREASMNIDMETVRANLEERYADLGETFTAADFEDYVDDDGDGAVPADDDNIPDEFLIQALDEQDPDTAVLSEEITITGITGVAKVTLTGGTLLINGESVEQTDPGPPPVTETFCEEGDVLQIQVTTPDDFDQTLTATLQVGETVKTFSVSTFPLTDYEFGFDWVADAYLNTEASSGILTISGLEHYHPVVLSNGTLLKNGEALDADGDTGISETTVVNGDTLQVALAGSDEYATEVTADLTIGLRTETFSVTTADSPLDITFGGDLDDDGTPDGFIVRGAAGVDEKARAVVIDDSGNIVIAGINNVDAAAWRFTSAGLADTSFSDDGLFTYYTEGANFVDDAYGLGIDTNDNVVLMGSSKETGFPDVAVWRLTDAGVLDTDFNGDGYTVYNSGSNEDAYAGAVISGDSIITAGWHWGGSEGANMFAVQFDSNGGLDSGFSEDGLFEHDNAAGGGSGDNSCEDRAYAVAVDVTGNILVAGISDSDLTSSSDYDIAVWRLTSAGILDTENFGTGGVFTHGNAAGGDGTEYAWGMTIDGSGNILVTGQSQGETTYADMVVWRLTSAGVLDTTFSEDGYFVYAGVANDVGRAITTDGDGNILVAGESGGAMAVWRLTSSGELDPEFDYDDGVFLHDGMPSGTDTGRAVAAAAGKIYVAGYRGEPGDMEMTYDAVLWCINNPPSAD